MDLGWIGLRGGVWGDQLFSVDDEVISISYSSEGDNHWHGVTE